MSLNKQKTRPRTDHEGIRKTIQKNLDPQKLKKINVKMLQVNKKLLAGKQIFKILVISLLYKTLLLSLRFLTLI